MNSPNMENQFLAIRNELDDKYQVEMNKINGFYRKGSHSFETKMD